MGESNLLLKVYDPATYPDDLNRLIWKNRELFAHYPYDAQESSLVGAFVDWWEKKSVQKEYAAFTSQFQQQMEDIWIEGFHITRTIPDREFLNYFYRNRGVCLPDSVFTREFFEAILAYIGCSKEEAINFIRRFYLKLFEQRDKCMNARRQTISLFTAPSRYVLHILDGGYWNLYGENMFGEIGREVCQKAPHFIENIFEKLHEKTCPHMIQVRFRLADVYKGSSEYSFEYVLNGMIGIMASKYFGGKNTEEYLINSDNSVLCIQVAQTILSDNILNIEDMSYWEKNL